MPFQRRAHRHRQASSRKPQGDPSGFDHLAGGSLAVLASGIVGNVANAFWHHASGNGDHGSIGASTAVFGAIGLLAASQLVLDRAHAPKSAPRRMLDVLAPLVGGLALLGALGSSERADLGAHLFGFLSGVVLGGLAMWPLRHRAQGDAGPRWLQALLGALSIATVVGAWHLALRH